MVYWLARCQNMHWTDADERAADEAWAAVRAESEDGSMLRWVEYEIEYVYGSYSGRETIVQQEDSAGDAPDPRDVMWRKFRRDGLLTLPMATRSAQIVSRRVLDDGEE